MVMDEDLDYNFSESSGVLGDDTKRSDPDIGNQSIIKQLLDEIKKTKQNYLTIDKLNLDDKHFIVEQQLELNKRHVVLLTTLELLLSEKLKELNNGR